MKSSDLDLYRCPQCKNKLVLVRVDKSDKSRDPEEIAEGVLGCSGCAIEYPIIRSIPRFVKADNYTDSFGYQWNKFAAIQVGREQKSIAKFRFDKVSGWPDHLEQELVLEAGCGAGRFTEIALDTGAQVWSFDLSSAVEACAHNLDHLGDGFKRRHHLAQADIYQIPFSQGVFDKIYCLGVLQHCPDVKKAFLSLGHFLKPGGELVVDCYLSEPFKHFYNLKYLLRPFLKWWNHELLYKFLSFVISVLFELKLGFSKIPLIGEFISRIIPIGKINYEPEFKLTNAQIKLIKTLSIYDMISPKYDYPQKRDVFWSWIEESGLEVLVFTLGFNGINAKLKRKVV